MNNPTAVASDYDDEIGPALVVTLCGSMRFYREILDVAAELTDRGYIVLAPFRVVEPDDQDSEAKARLDQLHRRKIDMADLVIVVTDQHGYIGDSTRTEIEYTRSLAKRIEYRPPLIKTRSR
jgi:hypothetical protein